MYQMIARCYLLATLSPVQRKTSGVIIRSDHNAGDQGVTGKSKGRMVQCLGNSMDKSILRTNTTGKITPKYLFTKKSEAHHKHGFALTLCTIFLATHWIYLILGGCISGKWN